MLLHFITHDPKWYIYKVSSYGTHYWYEVFKRERIYNTGEEIYPKAKRFGLSAWNVKTLEKALARIPEDCQKSGTFLLDEDLPIQIKKSAVLPKRGVRIEGQHKQTTHREIAYKKDRVMIGSFGSLLFAVIVCCYRPYPEIEPRFPKSSHFHSLWMFSHLPREVTRFGKNVC
jgi:hypothetical protein